MSKPLNNNIRQAIIDAVMVATFDARKKALVERNVAFADRAYATLIPAQFATIEKSLPPEWFLRTTTLRLNRVIRQRQSDRVTSLESVCSILDRRQGVRNTDYDFRMSSSRAFPHSSTRLANWCGTLELDDSEASTSLIAEHEAIARDAERWLKERLERSERLSAFLASVKTVQRLVETAPELKPYIPAHALADRAPAPAPIVGSLIVDLMRSGLNLNEVEIRA